MGDLSDFSYEDIKTLDEKGLYKALYDLASRVYGRYYSGYSSYKDDLIQEAVLKGWALLGADDFDSSRSSVYNYLFTGMRNQMTNYMKKIRDLQLTDSYPEGSADEEPDYGEWEKIIADLPDIAARAKILSLVEGDAMINFWDDVSDIEKRAFIQMVSKKTKMVDATLIFDNSGDLILWMLFLFHGKRMEFPPESMLEKYLRQVKIYYSLKKGMTPEEVAKKYDIRVQHISRIYASVDSVLNEVYNVGREKPVGSIEGSVSGTIDEDGQASTEVGESDIQGSREYELGPRPEE